MPLTYLRHTVDLRGTRSLPELARIRAKSHRAAHVGHMLLRFHQRNDRISALRSEFTGMAVVQPNHVACEFDDGGLHAEANSKKRESGFAGVADCFEHSFNSANTKTSGNQNGMKFGKQLTCTRAIGEHVARHPRNVYTDIVRDSSMDQCFLNALV